MNKEKQMSILEKIKERISNFCFNFNSKEELDKNNEEAIREMIFHYVGKENINILDIQTDKKGKIIIDINLVENEHTEHWINFFKGINKGE